MNKMLKNLLGFDELLCMFGIRDCKWCILKKELQRVELKESE